jgi:hypothetical protein
VPCGGRRRGAGRDRRCCERGRAVTQRHEALTVRFPAPIGVPCRASCSSKRIREARKGKGRARCGARPGRRGRVVAPAHSCRGQLCRLCQPRRQSRLFRKTPAPRTREKSFRFLPAVPARLAKTPHEGSEVRERFLRGPAGFAGMCPGHGALRYLPGALTSATEWDVRFPAFPALSRSTR